jgi:hypothetical protein
MILRHHLHPAQANPWLQRLLVQAISKPWPPINQPPNLVWHFYSPFFINQSQVQKYDLILYSSLCITKIKPYCLKSKNKYVLWRTFPPNKKCATSVSSPLKKYSCPQRCLYFFLLETLALVSSRRSTMSLASTMFFSAIQVVSFSWTPCHFIKYFFLIL